LKKIRKEQHTKRRLAKNALRAAYQAKKTSTLKPADMIQWQEFKDLLPIASVRAPTLKELITT
jgi:hypothetical protein